MKNALFAVVLSLLFGSCVFNTETNQNSQVAAETTVSNILKGNYEAIYEDASLEIKSIVPKEVFLNINILQKKMYGKMVEAQLKNETSGEYKLSSTNIYQYELKNEKGESFNLTVEYLRGHLLKSSIEEPEWRNESDFVKNLVDPINKLVIERNFREIHQLLHEKYPIEQIQSLIQKIAENCDGIRNKYQYNWTDNDKSGKMFIAFVYAYEKKGYLEYRFSIENNNYPFGGIYFTPDENTKLP